MKKIFTFIAIFTIALFANAIEDNCAYFANSNVQVGADGTIDLMINADNEIGSIYLEFEMPNGVTINKVTSTEGASININEELGLFLLGNNNYYTTGKVATFHVSVADDVVLGDYPMTISVSKIVEPSLVTYTVENIETTLTVQKTAVIEPQRGDYSFEAVPTCVATGSTSMSIPVNFANEGYVSNISFNIEYPEGMLTTKSGKNYTIDVNKKRFDTGDDATLTVKATSGISVSFTNGDDDLVTPGKGNLLSIPVTLTDVADGVYTIKFSSIKVDVTNDEADPLGTETLPDYYVSVFVGEPITDAILYGHYTAEGKAAAAAMKGGSADITAATVDGELSINDVLIMGKDKTSYARKVGANDYATICLPFAIAGDLYTVKEISETSITLAEATEVAANTPAIIKGNINFSKEGYVAPEDPVAGANGLTGTYKYIDKVTGYYLAGNKFYNDYADVKPFRAYIPAPATAKPLSILVETANGIIDITDQLSAEDIYSLQGIKMNKAQKGVNIVGGKKIYVK